MCAYLCLDPQQWTCCTSDEKQVALRLRALRWLGTSEQNGSSVGSRGSSQEEWHWCLHGLKMWDDVETDVVGPK
jgi:hypothetical protein